MANTPLSQLSPDAREALQNFAVAMDAQRAADQAEIAEAAHIGGAAAYLAAMFGAPTPAPATAQQANAPTQTAPAAATQAATPTAAGTPAATQAATPTAAGTPAGTGTAGTQTGTGTGTGTARPTRNSNRNWLPWLLIALVVLAIVGLAWWVTHRDWSSSTPPAAAAPAPAAADPAAPAEAETTTATASAWKEVDFKPTGGSEKTYNIDHDGKDNRITISWYHARPTGEADPGACVMHVSTHPDGERVTTLGAYRTWEFPTVPTKEDTQALVNEFKKVLESEPRGECAQPGSYTVTWQ